jgi:ribonuclease P protein component
MAFKLETIKGKKQFSNVFESGQRFFDNNSMAVVCFASHSIETASEHSVRSIFYSVSVPKRNAKKAVVRNRIKRLLRESLRQYFQTESAEETCPISHISLVWRNAPGHPALIGLSQVKAEVFSLMAKAMSFYSKNFDKKIQA